jgi:hypothetical protein
VVIIKLNFTDSAEVLLLYLLDINLWLVLGYVLTMNGYAEISLVSPMGRPGYIPRTRHRINTVFVFL